MPVTLSEAEPRAIGREAELARITTFLGRARVGALVIAGAPGIGKTTIWEAGLGAARSAGWRVLATRPAESEWQLPFTALTDLLAEIDIGEFQDVPAPQRDALEIVLYRAEPEATPPELSAASVGLARLLRLLGARQPLLVAVDDVAWMDRPSLGTLAFAARRLGDGPIRFLLTRRAGEQSELERALAQIRVEQLELDGLTLGAIRVLLAERLGLNLSRRLLRRLHEAVGGNPLLALELGRHAPALGDEHDEVSLSALAGAEDLFGDRVAALTPPMRRTLLAAALSPDLAEVELAALAGSGVEAALASGLLVAAGQRVRVSHPLLAAAVRGRSSSEERRALHLELARSVSDPRRRLHHAALGSRGPDAELAAELADAAAASLARGALHDAIELAQHALRLTPPDDAALPERLLSTAELLVAAGELRAVTGLLAPRIHKLPAGRPRARAHLLLGEAATFDAHERHLELALGEAAGEPDLVTAALSAKAVLLALNRVEEIERAEALARSALAAAHDAASPAAEAQALHALVWARILRGRTFDAVATGGYDEAAAASLYVGAVERPLAVQRAWRGQIAESRVLLGRLLQVAEERGEARSCLVLHLHCCELELRAGDLRAAAASLEAWEGWTADEAPADVDTIRSRCRALIAAVRGRPDEVAYWADAADAANAASGFVWDRLDVLRARGIAALQTAQLPRATAYLQRVWEHTSHAGIRDPGAFPVGGDLAEALIALGKPHDASTVVGWLRALAEEQRHPWGLATTRRCDALLALAEHPDETGVACLEAVASEYSDLGLHFEAARTLLAAGRAARRQRRWAVARALLERAAVAFDELDADGWVGVARANVGRRESPRRGGLTDAEHRVAGLAADGLSNKEIAAHLMISVSTVETHLKRIYAKLGVGSRTQLARRLTSGEGSTSG